MTIALEFHGIKGGVGTTTALCGYAVHKMHAGHSVTIVAPPINDVCAVLGVAESSNRVVLSADDVGSIVLVNSAADAMAYYTDVYLSDGIALHPSLNPVSIAVVRNDYLSLRRLAVAHGYDLVLAQLDPTSALREADVSHISHTPMVSINTNPLIARAIDAGLFTSRLPHTIEAMAAALDTAIAAREQA